MCSEDGFIFKYGFFGKMLIWAIFVLIVAVAIYAIAKLIIPGEDYYLTPDDVSALSRQ